ncbi:MAG: GatB/YqeY domain-containing protein [Candidatus Daviesbacteria bacterium]|nr:GatB/YqeY domain-containing protein [Candidatus Daviesbacteria bacterium]
MLTDQIQEELKTAQLARDETKVSTIRLLLAEVKNSEIAKGHELSDEEILEVVTREAKKRKEAAVGFRSGNREDSALKEEAELQILQGYLPAQMSDEELTKIVDEVITEVGAKTLADMGKVIGGVMSKVKGSADGGRVSNIAKQKLNG